MAISRGFHGRRRSDVDPARVPPGQYVTRDFPVLSAGPTPHTALEVWDFSIVGELDEPRGWTWEEFRALPSEEITRDIHCVPKWTKLDTVWRGVSVDTLLEGIETAAEFVTQYSDGGYTTNLPVGDVTGGKAGGLRLRRSTARARARRPRAHARPAPLLLTQPGRRHLSRRARAAERQRPHRRARAHRFATSRVNELRAPCRRRDARRGFAFAGRAAAFLRVWTDAVRRGGGRIARAARTRHAGDQDRTLWTHRTVTWAS